jgi:hypothetical protein
MSLIAKKKAQQKKGPETIFVYMSLVFILAIAIEGILYLILKFDLDSTSVVPIVYFLLLAGLFVGLASELREHPETIENFGDWIFGFVFLGIFIGAILAAYQW